MQTNGVQAVKLEYTTPAYTPGAAVAATALQGGCYNYQRCHDRLNDGCIDHYQPCSTSKSHNNDGRGQDWNVGPGLNSGTTHTKMWVVLDLGEGATEKCVTAIKVWNQNEYASKQREIKNCDLYSASSEAGPWPSQSLKHKFLDFYHIMCILKLTE